MPRAKAETILAKHKYQIDWYYQNSRFDFAATSDYYYKQMVSSSNQVDLDPRYVVRKETNLRIHETEFTDNYFDPFGTPTFED